MKHLKQDDPRPAWEVLRLPTQIRNSALNQVASLESTAASAVQTSSVNRTQGLSKLSAKYGRNGVKELHGRASIGVAWVCVSLNVMTKVYLKVNLMSVYCLRVDLGCPMF